MSTLTLWAMVLCSQAGVTDTGIVEPWPDSIGKYVRESVRAEDRLGYSREQLARFPGKSYRLGYINRMFEDVETLPQATNRFALQMLEGGYEKSIEAAMRILGADIRAVTLDASQPLKIEPVDDASRRTWEALPGNIHAAVRELVSGLSAAHPHLESAFDWPAIARAAGDSRLSDLGSSRVYQHGAGPWLNARGGTGAAYGALRTFGATGLGNAGVHVFVAVRRAIERLLASDSGDYPEFSICRLRTDFGTIAILGRGDNTYQGSDAVVIDLGGDDRYSGRVAVPVSGDAPVGLLIDIGGNDLYDGRREPASLACGLFGIGALFDLGGHDKYYCDSSGLGCGWHGIGLLLDTVGNDVYSGRQWTQGAAHAGVGMLIDEAGDDRYFCQLESQGLGGTLGVGVLVDKAGSDRYHAYDNENGRRITFPSSQTKSHEVSLVQGCGYGRRADTMDGRSMAGGVGALIDGAGDDSYYGGVFSQGIGFWWGFGALVDFGGHDTYRGVYYAQGAAAHFAIGSLIDHAGDDRYNDSGVLGQVLGAGRDGSVAALVDVAGDDIYYIPKKSAGGGDMNSIGVLSDKQGNDKYYPTGYSYLGTASASNPRGEAFRRTMPTIGIFVDLSGLDHYGRGGGPKNDARWYHQQGPIQWGLGLDKAAPAQ